MRLGRAWAAWRSESSVHGSDGWVLGPPGKGLEEAWSASSAERFCQRMMGHKGEVSGEPGRLGSSCWEVLGFQGGVEEVSWEEGRDRFEGPNCALGH